MSSSVPRSRRISDRRSAGSTSKRRCAAQSRRWRSSATLGDLKSPGGVTAADQQAAAFLRVGALSGLVDRSRQPPAKTITASGRCCRAACPVGVEHDDPFAQPGRSGAHVEPVGRRRACRRRCSPPAAATRTSPKAAERAAVVGVAGEPATAAPPLPASRRYRRTASGPLQLAVESPAEQPDADDDQHAETDDHKS